MRRSLLLATAVVLALAAYGLLDVRQRARLDRGLRRHRTDFTVYTAAAAALREGTDPYEARSPRGYRYVYPPLLAILLMPVAGWRPENAALLFFAVSAAALAATLRALARLPLPRRAVLGALLLCVPFLHQSFERGQVTILLLALQVAALLLLRRDRPFAAGLALAVGGALRLTPFLCAVAAGVGLLRQGRRPAGAFAGGLAAGLVLCFFVLPVALLGAGRARTVHEEWAGRTLALFGPAMEDLGEDFAINEYRFKNQAPRRVLATWTGWATGASFEDERPALAPAAAGAVDLAAFAIAAAAALGALVLGWRRLHDPAAPGYAGAFAAVILLPVVMTRYTWPTHYVAALPLAAVALAARRRPAWIAFATGTALFYLAHLGPLEPLGAAGPLLLGGSALLLLGPRAARS